MQMEDIRKALSKILGNVGNHTQLLKYEINFKAMPAVPVMQAIITKSMARLFQFLCNSFNRNRYSKVLANLLA
jgi:hypothetical protein